MCERLEVSSMVKAEALGLLLALVAADLRVVLYS